MIGDMISELRKDKGLLQKNLAKLLNVTVGTISNYENNTHNPELDSIVLLANFFDVSVDYMLERTALRNSMSIINKKLIGDITVADIINAILEFNKRDIELIVEYINLIQIKDKALKLNKEKSLNAGSKNDSYLSKRKDINDKTIKINRYKGYIINEEDDDDRK